MTEAMVDTICSAACFCTFFLVFGFIVWVILNDKGFK